MRRVQKVAALLKKELAPLVEEALADDLGMVTLTDVEVQPDLKEADVYISCFKQGLEEKILKVLAEHTKEFQRILGQHLKMKFTPKIKFCLDRGLENVDKIERLLEEIRQNDS